MNEDTRNNNKRNLFKRTSIAIIIFLILLFMGAFVYSHAEGWNYLDSLYFTVVTVTTIGYGDFAPQTNIGKIFTMFFPFIGIAMAFYFFSVIGKYVFKRVFESKLKEHHNKIMRHIELHTHKNYQLKRR